MAELQLLTNLDIEDDQCGTDASFFEEAGEVSDMINRVVESSGRDAPLLYDRFKTIVRMRAHAS